MHYYKYTSLDAPRSSLSLPQRLRRLGSAEKPTDDVRHRFCDLPRLRLGVLHVEEPYAGRIPDAERRHATHVNLAPDERAQPYD